MTSGCEFSFAPKFVRDEEGIACFEPGVAQLTRDHHADENDHDDRNAPDDAIATSLTRFVGCKRGPEGSNVLSAITDEAAASTAKCPLGGGLP